MKIVPLTVSRFVALVPGELAEGRRPRRRHARVGRARRQVHRRGRRRAPVDRVVRDSARGVELRRRARGRRAGRERTEVGVLVPVAQVARGVRRSRRRARRGDRSAEGRAARELRDEGDERGRARWYDVVVDGREERVVVPIGCRRPAAVQRRGLLRRALMNDVELGDPRVATSGEADLVLRVLQVEVAADRGLLRSSVDHGRGFQVQVARHVQRRLDVHRVLEPHVAAGVEEVQRPGAARLRRRWDDDRDNGSGRTADRGGARPRGIPH